MKHQHSILSLIFAVLSASSARAALDCKTIDSKQDSDGNLTYFTEVAAPAPTSTIEAKILRDAVSDFYGECGKTDNPYYCYQPKMTIGEVIELGEDPFILTVTNPMGEIFYEVNVGFGGGNNASYYFSAATLEKEKIMIVDNSECGPIQSILGYGR